MMQEEIEIAHFLSTLYLRGDICSAFSDYQQAHKIQNLLQSIQESGYLTKERNEKEEKEKEEEEEKKIQIEEEKQKQKNDKINQSQFNSKEWKQELRSLLKSKPRPSVPKKLNFFTDTNTNLVEGWSHCNPEDEKKLKNVPEKIVIHDKFFTIISSATNKLKKNVYRGVDLYFERIGLKKLSKVHRGKTVYQRKKTN